MLDTSDEAIEADLRTAEQAQSDRLMNLAMHKARLRVALRGIPREVESTFSGALPGGGDLLDVQVVQRAGDDVYVVPHGAVVEDRVEVANLVVAGTPGFGVWVLSDQAPWLMRVDIAARMLGVDYAELHDRVDPIAPAAINGGEVDDDEPTVVVPAAASTEDPAEHSQYADDEDADIWEQARKEREA